jgi:hypothetical protein
MVNHIKTRKNMPKNIECQVGQKVYHLICDIDSPLEHVKEALFQFQKYIGMVEDQIKASRSDSQPEISPEVNEEPKPD